MTKYSKESFKRELTKCVPLCANCHRVRYKDIYDSNQVHNEAWIKADL